MNAVVRPIHLPSATALNELRERANTALLAWAREWLGDAEQMLHRLRVKASETNRSGRYELLQGASGSLWVSCVDGAWENARVSDRGPCPTEPPEVKIPRSSGQHDYATCC